MSKPPPEVHSENLHSERRIVTKIIPIPKDARRFRLDSKAAGYPRDDEGNSRFEAVVHSHIQAHKKRLVEVGYTDEASKVIRPELGQLPAARGEFSPFDTPEAKASTRRNNELSAAMAVTLEAQKRRLIVEGYLDADGNRIKDFPTRHSDERQRVFENKRTRSF